MFLNYTKLNKIYLYFDMANFQLNLYAYKLYQDKLEDLKIFKCKT